jgi:hypothetical protein
MVAALIVLAVLTIGLGSSTAFFALRASDIAKRLRETGEKVRTLQENNSSLAQRLDQTVAEDRAKADWLDSMEQENDYLRRELEKRPKLTRKTFKILTLGVKWTGKTSLTLKWANPLIDLGTIQGTKIGRYERTVSHVVQRDITTEHVFEVGDWGGEHIVDALQELITDEIHGLLIVVDLGGKDATQVEISRVHDQLKEFQGQALKFFFVPKTVASCKAVVLFINKSDLIPGTPPEVERKAREYYAPLIDDLMSYSEKVDIRVVVGSAIYGHGTHTLFAHYVEKILPRNAYDAQLLQRMKSDAASAARGQGSSGQGGRRG